MAELLGGKTRLKSVGSRPSVDRQPSTPRTAQDQLAASLAAELAKALAKRREAVNPSSDPDAAGSASGGSGVIMTLSTTTTTGTGASDRRDFGWNDGPNDGWSDGESNGANDETAGHDAQPAMPDAAATWDAASEEVSDISEVQVQGQGISGLVVSLWNRVPSLRRT